MPQTLLPVTERSPLPHQWKPGQSGNPDKVWKPGQSGNPGGRGTKFVEAQSLCREASPEAARTMVELMSDADPRVRGYAADKVREWAWGKIPDYDPKKEAGSDLPLDPAALSPEQRQRFMQLLRLLLSATEQAPTIETNVMVPASGNLTSESDVCKVDALKPAETLDP